MDNLEGFKNITLTEAIEEIKKLRQSLIGAVQNAECREEKSDKDIERLKREKEWLLESHIQMKNQGNWLSDEKYRELILEDMQQALEE